MTIRVLIVEDEPLARDRLRQCLSAEPDVEILRECTDGKQATQAIRELQPDVVFLDVQIPEMNGFAVLKATRRADRPLVVIVTAYGEYALLGFEVNAVDYLLKPFDEERFRETMRRLRSQLSRSRDAEISRDLLDAFDRFRAASPETPRRPPNDAESSLTRIIVREAGRVFFLKTDDIAWLEAAGNYARAHIGDQVHLVRTSLKDLEAKLPQGQFARIHRGIIVNLEHVREIQPFLHGDYRVILNDGSVLRMSRRYRSAVLSDSG
jgi:two-component system LytT family response regulator